MDLSVRTYLSILFKQTQNLRRRDYTCFVYLSPIVRAQCCEDVSVFIFFSLVRAWIYDFMGPTSHNSDERNVCRINLDEIAHKHCVSRENFHRTLRKIETDSHTSNDNGFRVANFKNKYEEASVVVSLCNWSGTWIARRRPAGLGFLETKDKPKKSSLTFVSSNLTSMLAHHQLLAIEIVSRSKWIRNYSSIDIIWSIYGRFCYSISTSSRIIIQFYY